MKQPKWLKNIRMVIAIVLFATVFYFEKLNIFQQTVLVALALITIPVPKKTYQIVIKWIVALIVVAFGYYQQQQFTLQTNGEMSIYYLDVGQAECELIIFPDGKTGIIDGATYDQSANIIAKMKELGFHDIDYMFVTHAHADHVGGIGEIIKAFPVGAIYYPFVPQELDMDTFSYNHFIQEANKKNYKINDAKAGTVIDNDSYRIEIVYPNEHVESQDLNQYSMIIRIVYGNTAYLFTSDAGFYAEYNILQKDISADILKVGHHGSYESTSQQFLSAVNPDVGIISVGKENEHNLPNPNVLNRLEERGIDIYRTDLNGTIIVKSDGNSYQIEKER